MPTFYRLRNEPKIFLKYGYSNGKTFFATDRHRIHRCPTSLQKGYYDKALTFLGEVPPDDPTIQRHTDSIIEQWEEATKHSLRLIFSGRVDFREWTPTGLKNGPECRRMPWGKVSFQLGYLKDAFSMRGPENVEVRTNGQVLVFNFEDGRQVAIMAHIVDEDEE